MTTSDARIIPILRYRDARTAITWLGDVFGFSEHERFEGSDGSVGHAELRHGTGAIGISTAGPVDPANPWTNVRLGIYVCLKDVDGLHARIANVDREAIVRPAADTNFGARECSFRDPGGHLWSAGTYMMGVAEPSSLSACVHYQQAPAAMAWLTRAIGFATTIEVAGEPGTIAHAELRLGQDILMADGSQAVSPLWGDERQCTIVQVQDPDAHHARAAAAGARIVNAPFTTPYGSRDYYAHDLEGFLWGFSTYEPARESARG